MTFTPRRNITFTTDYHAILNTNIPLWLADLAVLPFTVAFAIKVPFSLCILGFPMRTHKAPTAGSVILAGVLLKMGTYGLVRFLPAFLPRSLGGICPD
jgi:NADH-quinone oxidoreductase subunit M